MDLCIPLFLYKQELGLLSRSKLSAINRAEIVANFSVSFPKKGELMSSTEMGEYLFLSYSESGLSVLNFSIP